MKDELKAKKSTPKTERIPTYKDAEGQYLAVMEAYNTTTIGWYLPDVQDFGLILANDPELESHPDETGVALCACIGYFKEKGLPVPPKGRDFEFDSRAQARECLRRINAELFYWKKNLPLPEWAKTALQQGWMPPKGWTP